MIRLTLIVLAVVNLLFVIHNIATERVSLLTLINALVYLSAVVALVVVIARRKT